jgi:hypothetical protein
MQLLPQKNQAFLSISSFPPMMKKSHRSPEPGAQKFHFSGQPNWQMITLQRYRLSLMQSMPASILDGLLIGCVCIYPGVPFIQIDDLRGALARMNNSEADYCFPVMEYPSAIQRAFKLLSSGKVKPFYPEFELTRTQDLEPAYHDAGQFYWGKTSAWLTNSKIHSTGLGFVIPSWRVVDIDTLDDWSRAEILAPIVM